MYRVIKEGSTPIRLGDEFRLSPDGQSVAIRLGNNYKLAEITDKGLAN